MNDLSPYFKIFSFPPGESTPMEISSEFVSTITSSRGLSGNSMKIVLPNLREKSEEFKFIRPAFREGAIIQLYVRRNTNERYYQENLGYVYDIDISYNAKGSIEMTVNVAGLERKLREQELFLDLQNEDTQSSAMTRSEFNDRCTKVFTRYSDVLKNAKDLPLLLKSIYDEILSKLSNTSIGLTFGGKTLFGDHDSDSIITLSTLKEGYTKNFIHTLNFVSNFQIGSSVNFWQLFYSLASEPLYECFFDSLETANGLPVAYNPPVKYSVEQQRSTLVFRRTPFDIIFNVDGYYNYNHIDEENRIYHDQIKNYIRFSHTTSDVYSGVHVGLSEINQMDNTLLNPPYWNTELMSIYGYKLLQVKMDGVTFPANTTIADIKKTFLDILAERQNQLYNIFCKDLKNAYMRFQTAYNFYRPGNAYYVEHESNLFGKYGYLQDVTNTFQARGQATSELNFKFVDKFG